MPARPWKPRWERARRLRGDLRWTLARAHDHSGDALAITGDLGSSDAFDRAPAAFAEDYAEQNERDFAAFPRRRRPRAARG